MERNWLKHYDPGVPHNIETSQSMSIIDMFEECVKKFSKNISYSNFGVTLTYQKIDNLSKAFAGFLQEEYHCSKGERVAIMLPNILQFPISMFGALRAGLIVVNINPLYTERELKVVLKDSGAKYIVILENVAAVLEKVIAETEIQHVIVTEIGDAFPFFKRKITNFFIKRIKTKHLPWKIKGAISFRETMSEKYQNVFRKVNIESLDIAYIQYTGGTTNVAKGVILTHHNILSNVSQIVAWVGDFFKKEKNLGMINALPLYHIFSLTGNCFIALKLGFHNILITNPKNVPLFIKELRRQPFSIFLGVNTLFNLLINNEDFFDIDFSHLKLTLAGAMSLQKRVADRWKILTGVTLLEGYGLTEASPVVAINPLSTENFNGSVGLPLPSTEVKICDDNDKEVSFGEYGELWIKGPQIMQGYWNKPEETRSALTSDGWLRTGDIGSIDEKGYIYLIDRKNDVIVVSGFNVYPAEIEEVISQIKGVKEVGVIGVPSVEHGEIVKAYIVRTDPALTAEEIIQQCYKNLTHYKVPREIEFREKLPKSNVGKILRRALREE